MKIISTVWGIALEILFPSKRAEKRVREMTLEDFLLLKKVSLDETNRIWSLFNYKNPLIREAIWQMKYRRNRTIAKIFAEVLEEFLLEELSDLVLFENFEMPLLIPIPMSKEEKRKRGFNQTEMLIEELAKLDTKTYEYDFNLLKKIKNTRRQVEVKKRERLENVKGAFSADESVKNRNIILIDDVYTTGSTLNEAGRILKEAGAKKVFRLVIAH